MTMLRAAIYFVLLVGSAFAFVISTHITGSAKPNGIWAVFIVIAVAAVIDMVRLRAKL